MIENRVGMSDVQAAANKLNGRDSRRSSVGQKTMVHCVAYRLCAPAPCPTWTSTNNTFLLFQWLFSFHTICTGPRYGERTQQMCSWFIGIRVQCQREERTRRKGRKTDRANKLIHLFQTAGDILLLFRKRMDDVVAHSALCETNYCLLKQLPSHAATWIRRAFLFFCTPAIHQCSRRAMCTDSVCLSSYCL